MDDFEFVKLGDMSRHPTKFSVSFQFGEYQFVANTAEALLLLTVIEEIRGLRKDLRAAEGKSGGAM